MQPAAGKPAAKKPALEADKHLSDYWYVLLRRRNVGLAVAVAILALVSIRSFLTRPVYEAQTQILIERENPNVLNFKEVAQIDAIRDDYYQTQYKLLQNRALVRKVIERLDLLQDPEFGGPRSAQEIAAIKGQPDGASPVLETVINIFLSRLRVQPVRNSRLVTVSFEAFRPKLATLAANGLSQAYIEQTLEFRYQTSSDASHWLGGQIEEQRRKVEAAEAALRELKERDGLVNIEERRTLLEQKLKELGTALTTLKTQRLQKEALYRQMAETRNPEELPEVMSNPLIQSLRIELAGLDRQQAQLLERYLDEHPEVIKVRKQIKETKEKIASEARRVIRAAENDYKAAAAQETSISAALDAAKAENQDLAQRSVPYDNVKRDLEASKEMLGGLLSRGKQTDVAQELRSSNIRIVDPAAVPTRPSRPNHLRDVLFGLFMGLGVAVAFAFFLDYLDNTLKSPEDVLTHLGAPLLGVIPELRADAQELIVSNPRARAPFLEGYRIVRTALHYSWPEGEPRILVVTSTAPSEGKTLTSVNLALTLAALEGHVLLIDGDLRKPQVHALLKLPKAAGFSDVLVGRMKAASAIQRGPVPNLSVLTAGAPAPSPADLLTTKATKGLLDELRGHYAWIVIDTPPVGAVAEALMLAPFADGVILVAGAEMVPRKAVRRTAERFLETGARLLGVVLNRARVDRHPYYYSGYYGHEYGRHVRDANSSKVASIRDKRSAR
jgi:capsular exopolysaccharide synthesis family protein